MSSIHILVGMPCSGKSSVANYITNHSAQNLYTTIDFSRLIMATEFGIEVLQKSRDELSQEYSWMFGLEGEGNMHIQKRAWKLLFSHPFFKGKNMIVCSHLISLHIIDGQPHYINGYLDDEVNNSIASITWLDIDPSIAQLRFKQNESNRVGMSIEQRIELQRLYTEQWQKLLLEYDQKLIRLDVNNSGLDSVAEQLERWLYRMTPQENKESVIGETTVLESKIPFK